MTPLPSPGGDGLQESVRRQIRDILAACPRVVRVVLFGSRAMGTHSPSSDVDVVLYGKELTLDDLGALTESLADLPLPQRVDLVLGDRLESPELREHIARYGVEWLRR